MTRSESEFVLVGWLVGINVGMPAKFGAQGIPNVKNAIGLALYLNKYSGRLATRRRHPPRDSDGQIGTNLYEYEK